MSGQGDFHGLMARVRAGDGEAAEQLVREYEPEIRRAVRVKLTDPRLRKLVDSTDICQSILGNFFLRVTAGQFDLEEPGQLVGLLVTMARNRVTDFARAQQAGRRDVRRQQGLGELQPEAGGHTPSQIVAGEELIAQFHQRLSAEERYLAEQRKAGRPWAELGEELGSSPEALRKRLDRAIDRVADELDLR